MARGSPRRRRVAAIASGAGVCAAVLLSPAGLGAQFKLDRLLAAYAAGDHQIVARAFTRSIDFHQIHALDPRRTAEWLGAWQRPSAAFLLELTNISSAIAPAYTLPLLSAAQAYFLRRPGGTSPGDDAAFDRLWHRIAVAALERRYFVDAIDQYVDGLRLRPAASGVTWDPRLDFGRAVAQEQRCWGARPALRYSSAEGMVAPGAGVPARDALRSTRCLEEAVARFETASSGDHRPEAQVRAGWILYQLGRHADARRSLDAVEVAEDADLMYWLYLFRGRVNHALERHADAERDYRTALESYPDAQSAAVGLALVLFKLHRDVEADEAAVAVRTRSGVAVDPWRLYVAADERFIERWLVALRRML